MLIETTLRSKYIKLRLETGTLAVACAIVMRPRAG